jgi:Uma2 family endonuclease
MSATTVVPAEIEPRIVMDRISYAQYAAINDAIVDRHDPRMIYARGRLTLLSPSRLHDWYAGLIDYLIAAVASATGLAWEIAGQATYRHPDRDAGVEGDRVYYFGENAERMRGPRPIDLSTQPPPDLVVEVEHTHPANEAVIAWGRIGAVELWRYAVGRQVVTFWSRLEDGSYHQIEQSINLPALWPRDVNDQLRLVRRDPLPRLGEPS